MQNSIIISFLFFLDKGKTITIKYYYNRLLLRKKNSGEKSRKNVKSYIVFA